jgi:zinc protease
MMVSLSRRHALGLGCGLVAGGWLKRAAGAPGPSATDVRALQATFLRVPSSPLIALRFVFRTGSQDDPKGKEGLAALTAAMVAKGGTRELSYDELLERFYPMAAGLSGACRREVSVFAGEVHRDNLAAYVPLATSMLTTPRFAPEDFERLKNEALDSLTKTLRGGDDEELGKWTLQLALYRDHPYGHVTEGTVQGLKAITLDDVKAFHRGHYTPTNLNVGVAGSVDRAFVSRLTGAMAAIAGEAPSPPTLAVPARPTGLEVTIVEKPADATAISLGFPIDVTRRDDDFYALAVANSYLGEHRTFNGKLMQDLRGKRGLNYGDYSYIEDFIQEGMTRFPVPNNPQRQQAFTIWLRPVPHDKAVFALRGALWEFDRMRREGLPPADFEATRSFLLNYSKLSVQTLSRRLGYAMDGQFYGRADLVTELAEQLPKLTVAKVNAAVLKHLDTAGFQVAIVTRDAAAMREALISGKPTPLAYDTQGTPDDVLAEDKVIAAYPLKDVSVKVVPVGEMFEM